MMRGESGQRIYLIRHGSVEFPGNIRRCIGVTDLPLSERGRRQARELKRYFENLPVCAVYSSKLVRAAETARILAGEAIPVIEREDLREIFMGEWENVPLADLKKTMETEPVKGEGRRRALQRFRKAVGQCLGEQKEDIAIVAHAGINCCFLADLTGKSLETCRRFPQPYGGISIISVRSGNQTEVSEIGRMPKEAPSEEECELLWDQYKLALPVREHCRAVARQALKLGRALNEQVLKNEALLNMDVIRSGALLHDLVRGMPEHTRRGAEILRKEGYPQVAEVIRQHHDLDRAERNEAAVVYLADKQVKGEQKISLEERFDRKKEHFANDKEALKAWERRYRQAKEVEALLFTGKGGREG